MHRGEALGMLSVALWAGWGVVAYRHQRYFEGPL